MGTKDHRLVSSLAGQPAQQPEPQHFGMLITNTNALSARPKVLSAPGPCVGSDSHQSQPRVSHSSSVTLPPPTAKTPDLLNRPQVQFDETRRTTTYGPMPYAPNISGRKVNAPARANNRLSTPSATTLSTSTPP